jgi:hypothetical protein
VQQLQSRRVAVLQVLELLEEHHRARRAVAVDERHPARRLDLEGRRDDREDGGDPAARGYRHVVLGVRGVERDEEAPGRGHHVDDVADVKSLGGVAGEQPALESLHGDAQPPARRGAQIE